MYPRGQKPAAGVRLPEARAPLSPPRLRTLSWPHARARRPPPPLRVSAPAPGAPSSTSPPRASALPRRRPRAQAAPVRPRPAGPSSTPRTVDPAPRPRPSVTRWYNFLEFLDSYKLRNEEVRQAYLGCPKNAKMTSGTIQKEIAECCAEAVTKVIKEEMDGCLFSILVDESHDISFKEQMAIVVR